MRSLSQDCIWVDSSSNYYYYYYFYNYFYLFICFIYCTRVQLLFMVYLPNVAVFHREASVDTQRWDTLFKEVVQFPLMLHRIKNKSMPQVKMFYTCGIDLFFKCCKIEKGRLTIYQEFTPSLDYVILAQDEL